MAKLRAAIIGAGQIARKSHIPNYLSMGDEVEIVGICDRNIEAAMSAAAENGIPDWFSDHKEMLKMVKPDIVNVCVPNKFHYAAVFDSLDAGCHVLCEKPPGISYKEAELMMKKSEECKRLLSYGFHLRHGENVRIMKEKALNGEFGQIYFVKAEWLRRRGIPGWGNFTNSDIQGGGPLIDIGVHMLDIAVYLMDYPEIDHVSATSHDLIGKRKGVGLMGDWDPDKFNVEDSLFGFIRFKDGSSLSISNSFALNMKEKDRKNLEIYGDRLGASIFPPETFGEERSMLTNTEYPFAKDDDLHFKSLLNFVKACRGEAELLVTAKQGAYVQKMVEALYESSLRGEPVRL
ncbi:Gfo/Idh/MocA family protein [Youngiibacter multivorans]|uniref:Dehydrogenase n=1 Tax=Youngiibacter multivorans TaxID=937251 RepID=A0ABS4G495_9CLOT|nr:Gfo/Idh/MocA family oxidoreductase [Youngiibacter multivorans]MBP1919354.1 putative dehydrogenase [Youngiibacter multivorans]